MGGCVFKQYKFDMSFIIEKELEIFKQEEDCRVKQLMDYVVTFKDKEVEIERAENQVNTNRVDASPDNREEVNEVETDRSNVSQVQDASGVDTHRTEQLDYIPVFVGQDPSTNVLYFCNTSKG